MNVLVDTPVWSLVLRRQRSKLGFTETVLSDAMRELIREGRVLLIGPIRQELLSGIRDAVQFSRIRDVLRALPDRELRTADFERAAEMSNTCRQKGIATSFVDMLICAVAEVAKAPIFSTDAAFSRYSRVLSLATFTPK
jgi:predicted nucleic acid-binding protein